MCTQTNFPSDICSPKQISIAHLALGQGSVFAGPVHAHVSGKHITVILLHSQAASIFLVGSRITVAVLQPIKTFCMKWPLKASFPGFYYLQYSVCKYGCLTKNHEALSCNVYPRTGVWYIQKAESVCCWLHLGLRNTNSSCLTPV